MKSPAGLLWPVVVIALAGTFTLRSSSAAADLLAESLIPRGSAWRYLDNGSNQGTNWIGPAFNDAAWSNGPARLGYRGLGRLDPLSFRPHAKDEYNPTPFR